MASLPNPGMQIDPANTALVITDPQNDFLSPKGVAWGVVGQSVTENNTVENIERLFKAAKTAGMKVFVSPHLLLSRGPRVEIRRRGGSVNA